MKNSWNEKTILIDNEPVSPNELIYRARGLNLEFEESSFRSTSWAGNILRENGHEVEQIKSKGGEE